MDILDTRPNLNDMVLNHEQQIKDLAAHLLELKQLVTPMMEFKRRDMGDFNAVEIDLVVRGLFALQKLQPTESAAIQQLINRLADTVYQVEKNT